MKAKWFLGEVSIGYKRTETDDSLNKNHIRNSKSCVDFFRSIFPEEAMEHHEEMWVAYLNHAHRPIGYLRLSKGDVSSTIVNLKELLQGALMSNASRVILMHNHPSGNTTPSEQDKELTYKVSKGLDLFDIKLLDHIILTKDSYTSFADEGLI